MKTIPSPFQNTLDEEREKGNQSPLSAEDLDTIAIKAHKMHSDDKITEEEFYNLCYFAALVKESIESSRPVENVLADVLRLQNRSDHEAICANVKDGQELLNEIYKGLHVSRCNDGNSFAMSA